MTNQNGLITAESILDTQHRLVLALGNVTSFDNLFALCIEAAIAVASMDCGCVYLVDQSQGTIRRAFTDDQFRCCPGYPAYYNAHSKAAHLLNIGTPIYAPCAEYEKVLIPRGRKNGICAGAFLPMHHQGSLIGCLNVASYTRPEVPHSARQALEIIAACLGQAIIRLQAQQTQTLLRQTIDELEQRIADQATIEDRYRALLEASPDAIGLTDMNRNLAYCTPRTASMFGYDNPADLIGKPSLNLFAPQSHAQVLADMERLVQEQHITVTHMLINREGTIFPGEVRASVVKDKHGHIQGMLGYIRDMSERQQARQRIAAANEELQRKNAELQQTNERLNRSRTLLYRLIDGLEDGLLLLDANGVILTCNQWLASLFEKPVSACVGQPWITCCQRMSPPFPGEEALQTLQSGQAHTYRVVYTPPSGTEYVFSIQSLPLDKPAQPPDDGAYPNCRMIIRILDITERVEIQSKIIQKERYTSTGRVAATVAHEVNTPLQSIQTMLHLIRNARKPQRETYLSRAIDEVGHIGRILRQLVELSNPVSEIVVPVNINTLVERVLLLTSGPRVTRKITLVSNLDADLPYFRGHADRVTQVILNLVLNAIDAMEQGGSLTVTTRLIPNQEQDYHQTELATNTAPLWITIQIEDTGHGIADDLRKKIFEPFYSTRGQRPGLGLAVCQQIVQEYHGQLRLYSQPGIGTTVTVLLPQEQKATEHNYEQYPRNDGRRQ
jgi:PAS domain S-box-containing protein